MKIKLIKNILQSRAGFSLVEIMIASGIISMLALYVTTSDKSFSTASKQVAYDMNRQSITSALQRVLSNKAACENTFTATPVNPNGTTGTIITQIRDSDNNVIMTTGQFYGSANKAGRYLISEMRASHYADSATNPSQHFNRAREMTFSVTLQQSRTGKEVVERFKLKVDLVGSNVSECDGANLYDVKRVCDMLQGVFDDSGISPTCRSIYIPRVGGADTRGAIDNSVAVELEGNMRSADGVLTNGRVFVGGTLGTLTDGSTYASDESIIRDSLSVGADSMPAGAPDGSLYLDNGLGVNYNGSLVANDSLRVRADATTGHARVFNAVTNASNHAATVGYVKTRLSELASHNPGDASAIFNDIANAFDTNNSVADSLVNYVCVGAVGTRRIGVRNYPETSSQVGIMSGNDCQIDVVYQVNNCQQDQNETVDASITDCPSIYGNTIDIDGDTLSSWTSAL